MKFFNRATATSATAVSAASASAARDMKFSGTTNNASRLMVAGFAETSLWGHQFVRRPKNKGHVEGGIGLCRKKGNYLALMNDNRLKSEKSLGQKRKRIEKG